MYDELSGINYCCSWSGKDTQLFSQFSNVWYRIFKSRILPKNNVLKSDRPLFKRQNLNELYETLKQTIQVLFPSAIVRYIRCSWSWIQYIYPSWVHPIKPLRSLNPMESSLMNIANKWISKQKFTAGKAQMVIKSYQLIVTRYVFIGYND